MVVVVCREQLLRVHYATSVRVVEAERTKKKLALRENILRAMRRKATTTNGVGFVLLAFKFFYVFEYFSCF